MLIANSYFSQIYFGVKLRLKQLGKVEPGKAGKLDKKDAFPSCGLILPTILSGTPCIPGC